ncbi:MAG: DUF6377 domain-containing protein [Janthinobacterium lividum]
MNSPAIRYVWRILALAGLLLAAAPGWAGGSRTDSLLHALDQNLARQATYDKARLDRLTALKAELRAARSDDNASFDVALLICNEYEAFTYDSAFAYSRLLNGLAHRLHDPRRLQTARIKLSRTLRSAGLFKDAFDSLRVIRVRQIEPRYRQEYYEACSIVYIELADYDQDHYFRPLYTRLAYAYADSSAQSEVPGTYVNLRQRLFEARRQHDLKTGLAVYAELRRLPLTPHQVAINASALALICEQTGQLDQALDLMAEAAIGDVQSATKEGIALFSVADYCYQRGDLQRAFAYLTEARRMAGFYRARQRQVQMSSLATRIDGQKIALAERQRQQARTSTWVVGLLAAMVLALAGVIYLQLRRLQQASHQQAATNAEQHVTNQQQQQLNAQQQQLNAQLEALNRRLNEANRIKEEYIGYYFSNASRYVGRLDELQKKLGTLLATRQPAAAQRLVDDIDSKAERAELLRAFDAGFVRLFPKFVAEFNALFPDGSGRQLADDQLLTPELRIFALMRLGITDSEQISQVLGYSIHTVYAYKTRVKNRSFLPNDAFEAQVLALSAL